MKKIEPLSLDGIKTYSLSERHSKVSVERISAAPGGQGGSFGDFVERLPQYPGWLSLAGGGRGLGPGPEGPAARCSWAWGPTPSRWV